MRAGISGKAHLAHLYSLVRVLASGEDPIVVPIAPKRPAGGDRQGKRMRNAARAEAASEVAAVVVGGVDAYLARLLQPVDSALRRVQSQPIRDTDSVVAVAV